MANDWRNIRPSAIGVVWRDDALLVERYETDEEAFVRPIGGGVEFREASDDAVVREFREELGRGVATEQLLGVVENVFTFQGEECHEITFVYEVAFSDADAYDRDHFTVRESDGSTREATWVSLDSFDDETLYPDGLLPLVRGETDHVTP